MKAAPMESPDWVTFDWQDKTIVLKLLQLCRCFRLIVLHADAGNTCR